MSWNDFYKLNTLSISTADANYSSVSIYANGKNQVRLLIKVTVVDSGGSELVLSDSDILQNLYLCDYQTGEQLGNEWETNTEAGDYVGIISGQTFSNVESATPRVRNLYLYLSCSKENLHKDIAVRISIPGVGDFNTTTDGTTTKNGPAGETGSVFKSPSKVTVNTIIPVDYSTSESVRVQGRVTSNDSFTTDVNDIKQERNRGLYDKHDGIIAYNGSMYIEPSDSNLYFTYKSVVRNGSAGIRNLSGMTNANGNIIDQTYKIPAGRDATGSEVTDFYAIFVDIGTYGLNSGTKRITTMQDFSAHIDPHVVFQGDSSLKLFNRTLNPQRISVSSVRYGFTFDSLRIPRVSDSEDSWSLSSGNISVDVTDNFGNSGVVFIEMRTNNGSPYIQVNDA